MLIAGSKLRQNKMNILIGLVIAMFIITAGYVGYHASQVPVDAEGHSIAIEPETLEENFSILELEKIVISKAIH